MRLGWLSCMKGTSLQGEEREARLESHKLYIYERHVPREARLESHKLYTKGMSQGRPG